MHQVFKYKPDSPTKPVMSLGIRMEPGKDEKHFCKPTDVAVDSDGILHLRSLGWIFRDWLWNEISEAALPKACEVKWAWRFFWLPSIFQERFLYLTDTAMVGSWNLREMGPSCDNGDKWSLRKTVSTNHFLRYMSCDFALFGNCVTSQTTSCLTCKWHGWLTVMIIIECSRFPGREILFHRASVL